MQSASAQPVAPALTKAQEEALRLERERKYEQVRDRIFGRSAASTPDARTPDGKDKAVEGTEARERAGGDKAVQGGRETRERVGVPIRGPRAAGEGRGFGGGGRAGRGRDG